MASSMQRVGRAGAGSVAPRCPQMHRAACRAHAKSGRDRTVRVNAAAATETSTRAMPKWNEVYAYLKGKQLRSASPEEAAELVANGQYVLVDVRPPADYEKSHPEGAASVPLYQPIDMSNLNATKVLKTIMFRFNGVNPIEPNPTFVEQIRNVSAGGKGVIMLCEAGGTMQASVNFPQGKASRSLQAAFRVLNEGLADSVLHLERGLYGWYQADLPITGEYKPSLGRTPMAAAEPTLQNIVASTGYELKPGDKPVEQKKGWF